MAGDYTSINLHSLLRRSVHVHKICKNVGSVIPGIHIQTTLYISPGIGYTRYLYYTRSLCVKSQPKHKSLSDILYLKGMHVRIFSIRAIHGTHC
jgi:hypothetical protein